ncbi:MAG: YdbL family protein [Psychromonas sp.]
MKKFLLIITLMLSFPLLALDLADAKKQGLVGETSSGLLGVVEVSKDSKALVNNINAKRIAKYKEIAEKNNMTLDQVSKLAGEKAMQKTPAGQFIQNSSGKWIIK